MEHHTVAEAFTPQQHACGSDMRVQGLPVEDSDTLRELLRRLVCMSGLRLRNFDWERAIDGLLANPIDLRSLEPFVREFYAHLAACRPGDTAVADLWAYDAARWTLVAPNGSAVQLSLAESQLIRFLFQRPGDVASREELLTALHRPHLEAYSRNLDVTVSRLRKKVEVQCRQKLPLTSARGRGYVFNAPAKLLA